MKRSDLRFVIFLTIPAVIFILAFFAYPVILLVFNSFFDVSLLSLKERTFVGFDNYTSALTNAKTVSVFLQTMQYTFITLLSEFILGFIAALTFHAIGKKSEVLRTIFLFPLMVAPIVAGLLWKFMLLDNFGILNYFLKAIGVLHNPSELAWLSDTKLVMFSVALPDIWLTTCFVTMVIYTGLQNIPVELIEAAKIDGANAIKSFWNITLPLLRPVIAAVIILRGIDAARTFDAIYLMTGGGPMGKSEVLSLRIYLTMIRYGRFGDAAAMATLFLMLLLVLCLMAFYAIWKPGLSKR
ncbi:MAG: sugar ABC transporter permease [Anaerolinea sp.]|nr:sugar ABC transporter permease [Anaerolinea sp.]